MCVVCAHADAHGGQRNEWDPWKLELVVVVSHATWAQDSGPLQDQDVSSLQPQRQILETDQNQQHSPFYCGDSPVPLVTDNHQKLQLA